MLKHNKKLAKLWDRAPKIKNGAVITLDRRFKATNDFSKELGNLVKEGVYKDAEEHGWDVSELLTKNNE